VHPEPIQPFADAASALILGDDHAFQQCLFQITSNVNAAATTTTTTTTTNLEGATNWLQARQRGDVSFLASWMDHQTGRTLLEIAAAQNNAGALQLLLQAACFSPVDRQLPITY
jgi:hypothetical protein